MANDRVFIKCKRCQGWKMLLKFFPTTGSKHRDNGILPWLDQHADCHPRRIGSDLDGDAGFSLHTEESIENGVLDMSKQNYKPVISSCEDENESPELSGVDCSKCGKKMYYEGSEVLYTYPAKKKAKCHGCGFTGYVEIDYGI